MTRPPGNEKGFHGKWDLMEWFAEKESILSSAERAQIYDELRKQIDKRNKHLKKRGN